MARMHPIVNLACFQFEIKPRVGKPEFIKLLRLCTTLPVDALGLTHYKRWEPIPENFRLLGRRFVRDLIVKRLWH